MKFRSVTINVKNNPLMPQPKVRHDVKRASTLGSIVGWNEIGPARYRAAIRNRLGAKWSHYFPKDHHLVIPNPISWRNDLWEKKESGWLQTHGGRARVTPSRYIVWVLLEHRATGKQVIKINTHAISAAWGRWKPTRSWRQQQWKKHIAVLENLIAELTISHPDAFITFSGDFNNDRNRVVGSAISSHVNGRSVAVSIAYDNDWNKNTHGRKIYDIMGHVSKPGVRKVRESVDRHFYSDHNAVVTTYEWL